MTEGLKHVTFLFIVMKKSVTETAALDPRLDPAWIG